MKNVTLEIPVIPEDLFELIDRYRGSHSREEYVLCVLQREILGGKPRIYA